MPFNSQISHKPLQRSTVKAQQELLKIPPARKSSSWGFVARAAFCVSFFIGALEKYRNTFTTVPLDSLDMSSDPFPWDGSRTSNFTLMEGEVNKETQIFFIGERHSHETDTAHLIEDIIEFSLVNSMKKNEKFTVYVESYPLGMKLTCSSVLRNLQPWVYSKINCVGWDSLDSLVVASSQKENLANLQAVFQGVQEYLRPYHFNRADKFMDVDIVERLKSLTTKVISDYISKNKPIPVNLTLNAADKEITDEELLYSYIAYDFALMEILRLRKEGMPYSEILYLNPFTNPGKYHPKKINWLSFYGRCFNEKKDCNDMFKFWERKAEKIIESLDKVKNEKAIYIAGASHIWPIQQNETDSKIYILSSNELFYSPEMISFSSKFAKEVLQEIRKKSVEKKTAVFVHTYNTSLFAKQSSSPF